MDVSKINKWLIVAKQLESPNKEVRCPFCENSILHIKEVVRPDGKKMDVYVECPACKEHTVYSAVDVKSV